MVVQKDKSMPKQDRTSITGATDWDDLGRRIRRAAAEADALGIDPASYCGELSIGGDQSLDRKEQ